MMIKEFAANTVAKAKEEVSVPNGVIVLIAVASFIVGLIVGILCMVNEQKRRLRKKTFNIEDYVSDLDFYDEDSLSYDGEEFSL